MTAFQCFGLLLIASTASITGLPLDESNLPEFSDINIENILQNEPNVNSNSVDENFDDNLRLTKGEIADILENLSDANSQNVSGDSRKEKALMLVLPYTSKDNNQFNIEELYTKPPVTRLVDNKNDAIFVTPTIEMKAPTPKPNIVMHPSTESPDKNVNINVKPQKVISTGETFMVTTTGIPATEKKYPNHRYPSETDSPLSVQSPQMYSDFVPITSKPRLPPLSRPIYMQPQFIPRPTQMPIIGPTTKTETVTQAVPHPTSLPLDVELPYSSEKLIQNINTPIDAPQMFKFSSQYDASEMTFPKKPPTESVIDILDSIGSQPTSTSGPDVAFVADTLTPDMRQLLMSFGLIENPDDKSGELVDTKPHIEGPSVNPMSYTHFKRLPDINPEDDEMEKFLSNFGLRGNRKRTSKELKDDQNVTAPSYLSELPQITADMIPESMHGLLEDIGIGNGTATTEKDSHIFNPEEAVVDEDEMKRLSHLLETIKKLEKLNRTIVQEDLMDLDIENIKSLTKVLSGEKPALFDQSFDLDPINYDTSVAKNQLKRQENTTETSAKAATTQAPETPETPSIEALAESFGGKPSTQSTTEASLPPPRRTGFYYLVDWNSFLEVGEEDKNRVNIRFSPQAGDPNRFYRVNVP